jgi:IclR family acetate operon transcriptional repressor
LATPKNRSVMKAFDILTAFRRPDEWLTSVELSRRANLPEASGYRLIQTLVEIGAVLRGGSGRYRPGMLLVSLSHNVAISDLLLEHSRDILRDLAGYLNIPVHMGVLDDGMVTYIAKFGDPARCVIQTSVGVQFEAYCTALGKVLLAGLPAELQDTYIVDGNLIALTPYTITDRGAFRAELEKVRVQGYAFDDRELSLELRCLAVPMCDTEGRTVAAISVSDRASAMDEARLAEVRSALITASAAIKRKVFPNDSMRRAPIIKAPKSALTNAAARANQAG